MTDREQVHVPNCFGCSQNNPLGLKLNFTVENDHITVKFTSNQYHMGPPGVVHGGIITAIIDESFSMLVRSLLKQDVRTIKEEFIFRKPAKIGEEIHVETRLKEEKSRVIIAEAQVYSNKNLIAQAQGTLFKIKQADTR